MKVIKDGKPKTYAGRCNICECEFEFEIKDINEKLTAVNHCMDGYYTVKCPCCSHLMLGYIERLKDLQIKKE